MKFEVIAKNRRGEWEFPDKLRMLESLTTHEATHDIKDQHNTNLFKVLTFETYGVQSMCPMFSLASLENSFTMF